MIRTPNMIRRKDINSRYLGLFLRCYICLLLAMSVIIMVYYALSGFKVKIEYFTLAVSIPISTFIATASMTKLKIENNTSIKLTNLQEFLMITQIILALMIYSLVYTSGERLYFGGTDTLYHLTFVHNLITDGHVSYSTLNYYAYFPLAHVIITEISAITDMYFQRTYFLMGFLVFAVSSVVVYLLSRNISDNKTVGIVAMYLYSFSPPVLYYVKYPVPRTISYVLMTISVYLLFSRNNKHTDVGKFLAVALTLSFSALLYHHLSNFQIIILLLIIVTFFRILDRNFSKIMWGYITISLVMSVMYSTVIAFRGYGEIMITTSEHIPEYIQQVWNVLTLTSTIEMQEFQTLLTEVNKIKVVSSSVYYAMIIIFSLLSPIYLATYKITGQGNNNLKERLGRVILFLLTGIIFMFAFFVPTPIVALRNVYSNLGIYRLKLFVSPFVAVSSATGSFVLLSIIYSNITRKKIKVISCIIILAIILGVSILAILVQHDGYIGTPSASFEYPELISYNWAERTGKNKILSDYFTIRYFESRELDISTEYELEAKYINSISDLMSMQTGEYLICRQREFQNKKILVLGSSRNTKSLIYSETSYEINIFFSELAHLDTIYANGWNVIKIKI